MNNPSSLPTAYQQFIFLSRYARFIPDLGRRETFEEATDRTVKYLFEQTLDRTGYTIPVKQLRKLKEATLSLGVMPSMRLFATAGDAHRSAEVSSYNCSFAGVDDIIIFDELMYILMCGTGAGFSVEKKFISKLPTLPSKLTIDPDFIIQIEDSREGWCTAFRSLIKGIFDGRAPSKVDFSKIRPAGTRLKTFGGRASGPEPLMQLFQWTLDRFKRMITLGQTRMSSLNCFDLICKIASVVVVGGVRRSALICLSDLDDQEMATAKTGPTWQDEEPQRYLANVSAVYNTSQVPMKDFFKEWNNLYLSNSGERGIFNREVAKRSCPRRNLPDDCGTNPCAEILLRHKQFCNLSETIIREDDTLDTLILKVRAATVYGTLQSVFTNFAYLSPEWAKNCEEERLLGVSLTGIYSHPILSSIDGGPAEKEAIRWLTILSEVARQTNYDWARRLGIPVSAAITCAKPSGTVSQLANCSSGMHPWHSAYYIRRVRGDAKDPLADFIKSSGVSWAPESYAPETTVVFDFPIEAPKGAKFRDDVTAIQQLELWARIKQFWCEHNPSVTVYVRPHEWLAVGDWVYRHMNIIGGLSFLPFSDHVYQQAPYEEVSYDRYKKLLEETPTEIPWDNLQLFEKDDNTTSSHEMACVGGSCEIV